MASQSPTTTAGRTVSRPGTARFRPAPLLLITSPAGFVLVVAVTLAIVSATPVIALSQVTSAVFAANLGLIVVRGLCYLLAIAWGAAGISLVAHRLLPEGGTARALGGGSLAFGALSVLAAAGQIVVPLLANGFTEATYGDTAANGWQQGTSMAAIWFAVVAAGLAALGLRAANVRPVAMLTIALICLAYLIADVTTRGGFPPFVIAFVWLAMGLLLRVSKADAEPRTLRP